MPLSRQPSVPAKWGSFMASEREKILRYYRASGDGELAARLLDYAETVLRTRKYRASHFLDPYGFSVAETIVAHFTSLRLESSGGYEGAERLKAVFVHEDFLGSIDFGITAVGIAWDARYYELSHRDMLGALMGLGIDRDVVGDIIMTGSGAQVVVDTAMAGFIENNLLKVGAAPVTVKIIPLSDITPRIVQVKEIRATVPSLRLDVVAAAGFGLSRTKMAAEIAADKIKVNWQEAKNAAQTVKPGDIISMRGRGRVEICEVLGQTKKGRTSIFLKRFV